MHTPPSLHRVWKDALGTAWAVNMLMIWRSWTWWLLLWVPILHGYKAINQFRNLAGMMGGQNMMSGQQDGTQNGYGQQQQNGKKKKRKRKRRG